MVNHMTFTKPLVMLLCLLLQTKPTVYYKPENVFLEMRLQLFLLQLFYDHRRNFSRKAVITLGLSQTDPKTARRQKCLCIHL